jgi:hypothetical protein
MRYSYKILVGRCEGKNWLGDIGVDRKIILKNIV